MGKKIKTNRNTVASMRMPENFLLPALGYAAFDIRKGKATEAALPLNS